MITIVAIAIPYILGILLSIYRIKNGYYPRSGYVSSFVKRFGKYGHITFWLFISLEELIRKFKYGEKI
jgi:hypothetical protein